MGYLRQLRSAGPRLLRIPLAIALLAGVAPAHAAATASDDPLMLIPARHRAAAIATRDQVATMRRHMTGTGFAEKIAALVDADVVTAQRPVDIDGLSADPRLSALAPSARDAIADLNASVQQALQLLGERSIAEEQRGMDHAIRQLEARAEDFRTWSSPGAETPSAPSTSSPVRRGDPEPYFLEAIAAVPDAAIVIATSLDRAVPVLEAATLSTPSLGEVAGCDLVDETPHLCVGSAANNSYTDDATLLIDLGGDDTYLNSAGGAPFAIDASIMAPVSINIDLSGDDLYRSMNETFQINDGFTGIVRASQGGAGFASVGMLVDADGDDRYEAISPAGARSTLAAQGASYAGVGALFDLAGRDRYSARAFEGNAAFPAAETRQYLNTQGASSGIYPNTFGGLLADEGRGTDAYDIDGGRVDQACAFPCSGENGARYLFGQGTGAAAVGVLFDDGGGDSFRVAASGSWVPPATGPWNSSVSVFPPDIWVSAQGSGQVGAGFLLGGVGDDVYEIAAPTAGTTRTSIFGQGTGSFEGLGALDDAGGRDDYRVDAGSTTRYDISIGDGCRAPAGTPCDEARAQVSRNIFGEDPVVPYGPNVQVRAQGVASTGVGYLFDHQGDDRYEVNNKQILSVSLHDRLSEPSHPATLLVESASLWSESLVAQGVASGPGGMGLLLDAGGRNAYAAAYDHEVSASASSDHAAGAPVVRADARGRKGVAAQGASSSLGGFGALVDLNSVRSWFEARSSVRATTEPDPSGARPWSYPWPHFHGSATHDGDAFFFAGGLEPVILSHPSQPTCVGSRARGHVAWSDCRDIHADGQGDPGADHEGIDQYGSGAGLAPMSPEGPEARLGVDTTGASASALVASARLDDQALRPIAGAPIHFDLQWRDPPAAERLGENWQSLWTVDAISDEEGCARAALPTEGLDGTSGHWRVLATYDGAAGVSPKHAAVSLEVPEP